MGLDADNAETQEIVDEEIIQTEEAGHWGDIGDGANSKAAKRAKEHDRFSDMLGQEKFGRDKVGMNKWVENKDWWKENSQNMDESQMTKKELRQYNKVRKDAQYQSMAALHFFSTSNFVDVHWVEQSFQSNS